MFIVVLLLIAFAFFCIILPLYGIISPIVDTVGASKASKKAHVARFFNKTLHVDIRDSDLRQMLKIEEELGLPNLVDVPDQHIYTGTTIGGVSVGHVETIKGGVGLSAGQPTGYYNLVYKYGTLCADGMSYVPDSVYYIALSQTLFAQAKKDNMLCRYLDHENRRMVLLGKKMPKWECQYLLDWLCGKH